MTVAESAELVKQQRRLTINCSIANHKRLANITHVASSLTRLDLSKLKLTSLAIGENDENNFPISRCSFPSLRHLNLSHNKLRQLSAKDLSFVPALDQLQYLNLCCNHLELLADDLFLVSQSVTMEMRYVHLAGNRLKSIPSSISNLRKLRILELGSECVGGNRLSSLPADIFLCCSELEELDLSHNRFRVIPNYIRHLQRLRKLNVYSNRLSSIPDAVSDLCQLEVLILAKNFISSIPPGLTMLSNLRLIDLSHNRLESISTELFRFFQHKSVLLTGNSGNRTKIPSTATNAAPDHGKIPSLVDLCLSTLAENMLTSDSSSHSTSHSIQNIPKHFLQRICTDLKSCSICDKCILSEFKCQLVNNPQLGFPDIPCMYSFCSSKCFSKCSKKGDGSLEW